MKNLHTVVIATAVAIAGLIFSLSAYARPSLSSLQAQIDALQAQIDNIQLTPGPQGEPGETGSEGPAGPQGIPGADGAPGVDEDARAGICELFATMGLQGPDYCSDPTGGICDLACGQGVNCNIPDDPDQSLTCGGEAGVGTTGASCATNSDCQAGFTCQTQGGGAADINGDVNLFTSCVATCVVPGGDCPSPSVCTGFSTPLVVQGVEYGSCLSFAP